MADEEKKVQEEPVRDEAPKEVQKTEAPENPAPERKPVAITGRSMLCLLLIAFMLIFGCITTVVDFFRPKAPQKEVKEMFGDSLESFMDESGLSAVDSAQKVNRARMDSALQAERKVLDSLMREAGMKEEE